MKNYLRLAVIVFGVSVLSSNAWAKFHPTTVDDKPAVTFVHDGRETTLPGEIYENTIELKLISKEDTKRSSPSDALNAMYSSNKAGDAQWIMEGFTKEDQDGMKDMISNPEILQKNTNYFSLMKASNIIGFVDYKEYKICLVQQVFDRGTHIVPVTLKQVEGKWLRTNALKADQTFDDIFSSI